MFLEANQCGRNISDDGLKSPFCRDLQKYVKLSLF